MSSGESRNGRGPTNLAGVREADWDNLNRTMEEIIKRPYSLGSPEGKMGEMALLQVQDFGWVRVEAAYRTVAKGIEGRPTARQLVLGVDNLLHPIPSMKPNPKAAEEAETDAAMARIRAKRGAAG
jgi:hypothetical protein